MFICKHMYAKLYHGMYTKAYKRSGNVIINYI